MNPTYSVVIPLKNEVGNIKDLIEELERVMNDLNHPWELICINDGSKDGTGDLLKSLSLQKPHLHIITFKHNYGQTSAFDAGFKLSKGEFVITLDGDGQNDPHDIPKLLRLIPECDLVCGIRQKREDTWVKRLTSKIANFVRNSMIDDGVQDTGCSLKVYRKSALAQIKLFQGMHRFLPALFKMEGFRVRQTGVNHRKRTRGKSNYHFFNRSFNTLADLLAVRWMHKRRLHYQIDRDKSQL